MGIFDKAKDLAAANPDKANQIIEQAGDLVDEKTGGKHAEHVDKGQDLARDHLGAGGAQPPADLPAEGETPPA